MIIYFPEIEEYVDVHRTAFERSAETRVQLCLAVKLLTPDSRNPYLPYFYHFDMESVTIHADFFSRTFQFHSHNFDEHQ